MKDILTLLALGFSFLVVSCNDGTKEASEGDEGGAAAPETVAEDSAEKLANDFEKMIGKMTSALKEVNEGADPEKVSKQIDEWKMEAQKLSARMKSVVEEDFDGSKEAFEEKMKELSEGEMKEAMDQFSGEMMKLGQEGKEEALKIAQEIESVMSELD